MLDDEALPGQGQPYLSFSSKVCSTKRGHCWRKHSEQQKQTASSKNSFCENLQFSNIDNLPDSRCSRPVSLSHLLLNRIINYLTTLITLLPSDKHLQFYRQVRLPVISSRPNSLADFDTSTPQNPAHATNTKQQEPQTPTNPHRSHKFQNALLTHPHHRPSRLDSNCAWPHLD